MTRFREFDQRNIQVIDVHEFQPLDVSDCKAIADREGFEPARKVRGSGRADGLPAPGGRDASSGLMWKEGWAIFHGERALFRTRSRRLRVPTERTAPSEGW